MPNKEAKFVHADMMASEEPQRRIAEEITLPLGNLTRRKAAKGCIMSWARYSMDPSHEYWSPTRCASSARPNIDV